MERNGKINCLDLQKVLKERIRGKIFISMDHSSLCININPGKGIHYKRNINDISNKVNIEDIANEIEYGYRRFITDLYFIRKGI